MYADYGWTLNTEFPDFNLYLPSNQLLFKITKQFNLFPSFTLAASESAAATDTQVWAIHYVVVPTTTTKKSHVDDDGGRVSERGESDRRTMVGNKSALQRRNKEAPVSNGDERLTPKSTPPLLSLRYY